jgi:hypothetical protein
VLAEQLGRLVERTSVRHGGRPVKWLGDSVMFYFKDPGPGVVAALEMVAGVAEAGLPPAHVGLHAGPVIFQEGDYYGQTVNVASRIADYARPGEVLVSQEVVDASGGARAAFREIGPVELEFRSPFHAHATTLTSSGLPKQNVAGSNPVSRSNAPHVRPQHVAAESLLCPGGVRRSSSPRRRTPSPAAARLPACRPGSRPGRRARRR